MLDLEIKYGYNDVSIVPAKISYINHRFNVNPYYDYCMLPIFAAPMSSIYVKNDNQVDSITIGVGVDTIRIKD